MKWNDFTKSAVIAVSVPSLLFGLPFISSPIGFAQNTLSAALSAAAGVYVGSRLFGVAHKWIGPWREWVATLVSVIVTVPIAASAGGWIGYACFGVCNLDWLRSGYKLAMLNLGIASLVGAVIAGIVGLLFGLGLGQRSSTGVV